MVREFEDNLARGDMPGAGIRSHAPRPWFARCGLFSPLLSDAQERGTRLPQRRPRTSHTRKRGKERQAEKRQKSKLKVGVDIPTRDEIKAIVEAAKGRWRPCC